MPAPPHRSPKGQSSTLAKEYVERYPGLPRMTIARILFSENPGAFGTLNAASCAVRYVTGTLGKKHRKGENKTRAKHRPPVDPIDDIPQGVDELGDLDPHVLTGSRIGLMYDVHVPYHDTAAVKAALRWWRDEDIDHLFIGGDLVDFYALSSYDKDPERIDSLPWELLVARQFLESLRAIWPEIPFTMIHGNHEERLKRYIVRNAQAIATLHSLHLDVLLDFEKYGVTLVPEHHYAQAGHMKLIHGHEFRQRSAQNPAQALARKAREAVTCGHWHRHDNKTVNTPISRDRTYSCHSVGTLGTLRADFMPFNEWTNGAALLRVDADGSYRMENRLIIDGEVV